jgi:hypothetical protein
MELLHYKVIEVGGKRGWRVAEAMQKFVHENVAQDECNIYVFPIEDNVRDGTDPKSELRVGWEECTYGELGVIVTAYQGHEESEVREALRAAIWPQFVASDFYLLALLERENS